MELQIEQIEVLLLIAAIVAMVAARLRIPYIVGLVMAGLALSFLHIEPELDLTRELIFTAFLPPLVFEAALYMRWQPLRRDMPVVLVLATIGVVLSAAVTAAGMHYAVQWEWTSAIIFGVLIAYGSFLLADRLGFSGVLATVTAGLVVGNVGPLGSISAKGRESVESFWEYIAFVANSLIFLLIRHPRSPTAVYADRTGDCGCHCVCAARPCPVRLPDLGAFFPRRVYASNHAISTCCSGAACGAPWPWRWRLASRALSRTPMRSFG